MLSGPGEQSSDNKVFQEKAMNFEGDKIELDYNHPSREKGKSINELAIKILVLGCKAIMVCGNLPIEDWPYAMFDTIYLRQRHPIGAAHPAPSVSLKAHASAASFPSLIRLAAVLPLSMVTPCVTVGVI